MILAQKFLIHSRFIVITFHKSFRNNLRQIRISFLIFCQKHKMIISVISSCDLAIKTRIRSHIHFASKDWIDSLLLGFPIEIDHTIHNTVICNCRTVHPKFFDPGHVFFYLIRSIQQTKFCMDMQMCKTHSSPQ